LVSQVDFNDVECLRFFDPDVRLFQHGQAFSQMFGSYCHLFPKISREKADQIPGSAR
jgi:hypothetical protein